MSEAQAIGLSGPETEVIEATPLATPSAATNTEELVSNALLQAGVTDLASLSKPQAQALLKALEAEQAKLAGEQTNSQTKGLGDLIASLKDSIQNWPESGSSAIEQELDRAQGARATLQALQGVVGNGSVGLAGKVDTALADVDKRASALSAATQAIDKQLTTSGADGAKTPDKMPDQAQERLQMTELKDTLSRLKEDGGYTQEQLDQMGITSLQSELEQALFDPNATGASLRRAGLEALGTYFQSRIDAGEIAENSPAVLKNKALLQGLNATSNLNSLNKAWETEARSVTRLQNYTKENILGAAEQLEGMMKTAIARGDSLAAGSIKAKMDALNQTADGMSDTGGLGMGAMLLFNKLNMIDLVTKKLIRNELFEAKKTATSAGDTNLANDLQSQVDTLDAQIEAMTQHLEVTKEQMHKVMDDVARHTQEIEKQAF